MRYQERIYIQNDNRVVRNKDILNVNMSSDICIFQSPTFDLSGATKVQCDSITCSLSGVSLDNILTAATVSCFGSATTAPYTATTWETKIYEDGSLVYSKIFYTSTETYYTNTAPSLVIFSGNVTYAFSTLGYNYIVDGTSFIIDKPYGIKNLELDVCISFSGSNSGFTCPIGYSATPANDICQKILSTAATYNGSGSTIISIAGDPAYGVYGTVFYPSIESGVDLPVRYTGGSSTSGNLVSATDTVINGVVTANTTSFWASLSNSSNGRLNNSGISGVTLNSEYVGFTKCIDIDEPGTYYVGIAADNHCKFYVDGIYYAAFTALTADVDNFRKWSVFPFNFTSGKHIIEMYGKNNPSTLGGFAAEVYNPTGATPFATLTAATSTASTEANVIFSTENFVGLNWQLGTTVGYSCPSGFALDLCDPLNPICIEITTTGITSGATGTCLDNCVVACDETFPYIDNTSQGVYVIDTSTTTELNFRFNFTGNTNTFTAKTADFKYEVYKYNKGYDLFGINPVYKSDIIGYSSFSATNSFDISLSVSGLSLDGEYLVKGYYQADACTDFLSRLGKRIDTTMYKAGSNYQLYTPELDYYFAAITKADKPDFIATQLYSETFFNWLPLYQQVILVDDPFFADERTGSTFALVTEYVGDVIVTLNGLVMAKDVDYSLSGSVLTFYGPIINTDVITLVYTRIDGPTLIAQNILIDTVITSGSTNLQGGNTYYYNTTTEKYEIYTNNQPLEGSKIMVMLNGVTLADGIDYYQSTSNISRIILIGTIMVGDILTIIYYPKASIINGITQTNNNIAWYIPTPPQLENGIFELQYGTDSSLLSYSANTGIPYKIGVTNYADILTLSGTVGTKMYYRVKNTKNYISICGDEIESIEYSEIVSVVIQSNAINSY